MNLKYNLYDKYLSKDYIYEYNKLISNIIGADKVYIITNNNNHDNVNPVITPVEGTDWLNIIVFLDRELALKYMEQNRFNKYGYLIEISKDKLLITLDRLFYKGVTGVLYNGKFKNAEKTIFIPIYELYKEFEDTLITKDNETIIKCLIHTLYCNELLYYIYHPSLSANEISMNIVRYADKNYQGKKYIDIFQNEYIAELYCKKKKIFKTKDNAYGKYNRENIFSEIKYKKESNKEVLKEIDADKEREKYPITSINNAMLFHSINTNLNKKNQLNNISFVRFHTKNKYYDIKAKDFLQMVINIGFPQLDFR